MRGDTSIDSQVFKNSRNWSVWNCFRFLSHWKCPSKWDGKMGRGTEKENPKWSPKHFLCSQCHERLNKLKALDASTFLIGKEGNYFCSQFKTKDSTQIWPLALQVSKSKVPVTRMWRSLSQEEEIVSHQLQSLSLQYQTVQMLNYTNHSQVLHLFNNSRINSLGKWTCTVTSEKSLDQYSNRRKEATVR